MSITTITTIDPSTLVAALCADCGHWTTEPLENGFCPECAEHQLAALFEEDEPKEPTLADSVRICLGADDHLRAALEIASGIGVGALEQVIRREHLGLLWQGPTPACTVNAVVGDGTVACGH